MALAPLIMAIVLFLLGILIRIGKASWLIAGYNTMSKDEKAKYDDKALSRFVSNILLACVIIQLIEAKAQFLNYTPIIVAGFLSIVLLAMGAGIYANTGNRFKKK